MSALRLVRGLRLPSALVVGIASILVAQFPQAATVEAGPLSVTPRLFIGAAQEEVLPGGSTTLSWNIPGASSCMVKANGFNLWGGVAGTGNTATYGSITQDTTYTIDCTMSAGGSMSGAVTVRVVNILAAQANVPYGGGTTISWSMPGATSCLVAANGFNLWGGVTGSGTTSTYGTLTQDTLYRLTCSTPSGPVERTTVVRVPTPASPAPSFASLKGVNVFSGSYWFGDTPNLISTMNSMNVNTARLVVDLGTAVRNGTEADLVSQLTASLNALSGAGKKALVTLAGYSTYELAAAPCTTYPPFVDVRALASSVVTALNNHSALYAYELQNEAISSQANAASGCSPESVAKAVYEMYKVVKSIDSNVPTTVSEAWYWQNFSRWAPDVASTSPPASISSFLTYHIYPGELGPGSRVTTPLNMAKLDQAADRVYNDIAAIRARFPGLPVVVGEFGYEASERPLGISNTTFSSGIAGWGKYNPTGGTTTLTHVTTAGSTGEAGFLRMRTTVGNTNYASAYTDVVVAPVAGNQYEASLWVRSPSGAAVTGILTLWSLGSTATNGAKTFTATSQWQQVRVRLVPPVAATQFRAQVYLNTANQNLDIDTVRAVELSLNDTEVAQFYQRVYDRLSPQSGLGLNVGSFFWNISRAGTQQPYSLMNLDGTLKPAGLAVQQAFAASASFPSIYVFANPSIVSSGQNSLITWSVSGATSCMVSANGFNLWGGTSGSGNTSTYGAPSVTTEYRLTCAMSNGTQKIATTKVYVVP